MRRLSLIALLLAVGIVPAAGPFTPLPTPASETIAAAKAILLVSEDDRRFVQFLSLYAIPAEEREEAIRVLNFHINSLSRRPSLSRPKLVSPTLLLLDRRDYGWLRAVTNRLADVDPYFHQLVKIDGKVKTVNAPWLPAEAIDLLVAETRSRVPILRADWFFTQTAISKGRVAGYYAFLQLKNRADFQKLVGFDKKNAQDSFREVATILQRSKVSQRNRQIFRFGAADSGYWETRDQLEKQSDEGNAINQLDNDFVHQAEELYGVLPNDLFAMHLNDAAGGQQQTAPDEVGADTESTSLDPKIHAYLSCVRCHKEGLRPIRDFARPLFGGPIGRLVVAKNDKKLLQRLEQLYLKDYERKRKADNLRYAAALAELNGEKWTPIRNAEAVKEAWRAWNDARVTRELAARELGVSEAVLKKTLVFFSTPLDRGGAGQILPNTLLAYVIDPPATLLREHFEEHFGLLFLISRGIIPGLEPAKRKAK